MERIALLIERLTSYKILAPLADRALADGLEVWLILSDDAAQRSGPKAYDRPVPERMPAFRAGAPHLLVRRSFADVVRLCRERSIDVIFSVGFDPTYYPQRAALAGAKTKWVALQHASDIFAVDPAVAELPDRYCVYTDEWAEMARGFFAHSLARGATDPFVATGATELDVLPAIDPEAVRAAYGLGPAPVVLWLPHDIHRDDAWELLRYRGMRDVRLVGRAIRAGRWDLLAGLVTPPILTETLRALRAFCDRSGAILVTKSRVKDRPETIEQEVADVFTFDREPYPPTILELLTVSDACFHVFSHVCLEAAALSVPTVSFAPPADSTFMRHGGLAWRMVAGDVDRPGGPWNAPGVATVIPFGSAAVELSRLDLGMLQVTEPERGRYLKRYVGAVDGESSARVLRAAAALA